MYSLTFDELMLVLDVALLHSLSLANSTPNSLPYYVIDRYDHRKVVIYAAAGALLAHADFTSINQVDRLDYFEDLYTAVTINSGSSDIANVVLSKFDNYESSLSEDEVRAGLQLGVKLVKLAVPAITVNSSTDVDISYLDTIFKTSDGISITDVLSIPTEPFPPFTDGYEES